MTNWANEIVKAGYRAMAVKHHPDRNLHRRAEAEVEMQAINAARDELLAAIKNLNPGTRIRESSVRVYPTPTWAPPIYTPPPTIVAVIDSIAQLLRQSERTIRVARRANKRK